jgi:hypothetical protein
VHSCPWQHRFFAELICCGLSYSSAVNMSFVLASTCYHVSNRQNYCNTNLVLLRLGLSEVAQNLHNR